MKRLALLVAALAGGCSSAPAPARRPAPTTTTRPTTTVAPTTTTVPPTTTTTVPRVTTPTASPGPEATIARTAAPPPPLAPVHPAVPEAAGAATTTARASWYGRGARTANGERFEPDGLTYAHLRHAFGTMTRFCHAGACIVARCNDRGPAAWTGRTFDLSRGAFAAIAPLGAGVVTVTWEIVG